MKTFAIFTVPILIVIAPLALGGERVPLNPESVLFGAKTPKTTPDSTLELKLKCAKLTFDTKEEITIEMTVINNADITRSLSQLGFWADYEFELSDAHGNKIENSEAGKELLEKNRRGNIQTETIHPHERKNTTVNIKKLYNLVSGEYELKVMRCTTPYKITTGEETSPQELTVIAATLKISIKAGGTGGTDK